MALNKCVIISDCPSTNGILIDGETAILVPMRDPERLRAAIQRAWEDDDYRRRIAAGGYRYAMSLGGEETLARNVAVAVADFLNQRGAK
jgi:glycosyltransferase involved in cell wall biosynthesis